jgi:hypothetical protein
MRDQLGGWKKEHRSISDLAIYIALLIFGSMAAAALLIYQNYLRAR